MSGLNSTNDCCKEYKKAPTLCNLCPATYVHAQFKREATFLTLDPKDWEEFSKENYFQDKKILLIIVLSRSFVVKTKHPKKAPMFSTEAFCETIRLTDSFRLIGPH